MLGRKMQNRLRQGGMQPPKNKFRLKRGLKLSIFRAQNAKYFLGKVACKLQKIIYRHTYKFRLKRGLK